MLKINTIVKVNNASNKKSYMKVTNGRVYDDLFRPCVELTDNDNVKYLVPSANIKMIGKSYKMVGVN